MANLYQLPSPHDKQKQLSGLPWEAVAAAGSSCLGTRGVKDGVLAWRIVCSDSSTLSSWLQKSGWRTGGEKRMKSQEQLYSRKDPPERAVPRAQPLSPNQRTQPCHWHGIHGLVLLVAYRKQPRPLHIMARAFPTRLLPSFISHTSTNISFSSSLGQLPHLHVPNSL
jgi:hypothetical protein